MGSDENERLLAIARNQRIVILGILGAIAGVLVGGVSGSTTLLWVLYLPAIVAQIYGTVGLANALWGVVAAIVFVLLAFIPLVGLLALLILNGRATAELKKHDVEVGFLGVGSDELERLRAA